MTPKKDVIYQLINHNKKIDFNNGFMIIRTADFLTSSADYRNCPAPDKPVTITGDCWLVIVGVSRVFIDYTT